MLAIVCRIRGRSLLTTALCAGFLAPAWSASPGEPLGPEFPVPGTAVARTPGGAFVIAYLQADALLAQRYAADGSAVGGAITVKPAPAVPRPGYQLSSLDVATDASGGFVVAWEEGINSTPSIADDRVAARSFNAAGTANGPELQVSGLLPDIGSVVVDMNGAGDFVVAWDESTSHSVGVCGEGNGLCSFLETSAVNARRYGAGGGTATAARTIDSASSGSIGIGSIGLPTFRSYLVKGPSVTLREDGSYVVAWHRDPERVPAAATTGVFLRTVKTSGIATSPMKVAPPGALPLADPQTLIGSDAGGGFAVAYIQQQSFAVSSLHIDHFGPAGNRLGPTQRVDDGSQPEVRGGDLTMDSSGNHVLVWQRSNRDLDPQTVTLFNAVGQRYASGGGALGGNFALPGNPAVDAFLPRVASDANGNFVTSWSSGGQGKARLFQGP